MVSNGDSTAERTEFMPLLRRSIPRRICRAIEHHGVQTPPAPAQNRNTLL
jgi:hypothetical protein